MITRSTTSGEAQVGPEKYDATGRPTVANGTATQTTTHRHYRKERSHPPSPATRQASTRKTSSQNIRAGPPHGDRSGFSASGYLVGGGRRGRAGRLSLCARAASRSRATARRSSTMTFSDNASASGRAEHHRRQRDGLFDHRRIHRERRPRVPERLQCRDAQRQHQQQRPAKRPDRDAADQHRFRPTRTQASKAI